MSVPRILVIGNYPPPMCGWAIQTKLVVDDLRRRGYSCNVLKINGNRRVKGLGYIEVRGPWDYMRKVIAHCVRGFSINVHVNGMSAKGYVAAVAAIAAARIFNRPALLTFHGGLSQKYFPRHDSWRAFTTFRALFWLANGIACDSEDIRNAIAAYRITPAKIAAVETFSAQYVDFSPVALDPGAERFLAEHHPVFFCYVSFRPEYRLSQLRRCVELYRQRYPQAGFIWLGFPAKEFASARQFVATWPEHERSAVLVLPNLGHDEFLTLMSRCLACLRTPACDGVAASVLEALTMRIPVVASDNGRRPQGVVTYVDDDVTDMCAKLFYVTEQYEAVKSAIASCALEDNVRRMADWLLSGQRFEVEVPQVPRAG